MGRVIKFYPDVAERNSWSRGAMCSREGGIVSYVKELECDVKGLGWF